MSRPQKLLVALLLFGFVAFLAYTTLSAQKVECEVCVEFGSGRNCATASGNSEKEAAQGAQTTACGPLAHGMDASIACGNVAPVRRACRVR